MRNLPLALAVPIALLLLARPAPAQDSYSSETAPPAEAEAQEDVNDAPTVPTEAVSLGGAGIGAANARKPETKAAGSSGGGAGGGASRDGGGEAPGEGPKVSSKGTGQVGQFGGHRMMTAREGEHVAVPFHTRGLKASVDIAWAAISSQDQAEASWKVSVSAKPGDFSERAGCNVEAGETGLVHGSVLGHSKTACQLQPNKVYYFNMLCVRAVPQTSPCVTSGDIWYNEIRPDGTYSQVPSEWAKP